MKSTIIIILLIALLGTWGYIIFDKNKTRQEKQDNTSQIVNSDSAKNELQLDLDDAAIRLDELKTSNVKADSLLKTKDKYIEALQAEMHSILNKKNATVGPRADARIKNIIYPQFPLSPPRASAFKVIPKNLFLKPNNDKIDLNYVVNNKILPTLDKLGYIYTFYSIKESGIAIVTKLEKINLDGTSKDENERYLVPGSPPQHFSMSKYLHSLFIADPGYYRVIVFMICPYPIIQSHQKISKDQADSLLTSGASVPKDDILLNEFSSKYQCTALIYQFIKSNREDAPIESDPSQLTCQEHLEKAQIWSNLLKIK